MAYSSPSGGNPEPWGTMVTLDVSDGQQMTTVPADLIGETASQAQVELANVNLEPQEVFEPVANPAQDGHVISTDPAPGTAVRAGNGRDPQRWRVHRPHHHQGIGHDHGHTDHDRAAGTQHDSGTNHNHATGAYHHGGSGDHGGAGRHHDGGPVDHRRTGGDDHRGAGRHNHGPGHNRGSKDHYELTLWPG